MNRRVGITAMAGLTSFLFCGFTAPQTCQPQPQPSHTGAEVAGISILAGVVIGTVILVDRNHAHHTIKGCVSMSQNGLEVQDDSDKKTYALAGVTTNTKAGDVVRLHGKKEKKAKDSAGDRTFTVEKISKDFGPCKVQLAAAPTAK